MLTIFDGQDLMSNVIGQYVRSKERFQVVSGGSEVTIQFQSDPDDSSFISSQGFVIHYRGKWVRSSTGEGEVLKDICGLPIYCLCRGWAKWHLSHPPPNWVWLGHLIPLLQHQRHRADLSVPTGVWHQWLWQRDLSVGPVLEQQSTYMY